MIRVVFVVLAVAAEHGDVDVRVLHPGVFPVCQLKFLLPVSQIKQEVVRHRVHVSQAVRRLMFLNILPEGKDLSLRLFVVRIQRRRTLSQVLVILDLFEEPELMSHLQLQIVQAVHQPHTADDVFLPVGVAHSDAFQVPAHLQPVLRINIRKIVADAEARDSPVHFRFLLPVDEAGSSFSGDPENIAFSPAGKTVRAVGHSFGHGGDSADLPGTGAQRLRDLVKLLPVDGPGDLFLQKEQALFCPAAGKQPLHRAPAFRRPDIDQDISRPDLRVISGRKDDLLSPADRRHCSSRALPEMQIPQRHADLVRIRRHLHLILRQRLLCRERCGPCLQKPGAEIHDLPPHLRVLPEQGLKLILQIRLFSARSHRLQPGARLLRRENNRPAALPGPDDPHIRQKLQRFTHCLRRNVIAGRKRRPARQPLPLRELPRSDASRQIRCDPHILRQCLCLHAVLLRF